MFHHCIYDALLQSSELKSWVTARCSRNTLGESYFMYIELICEKHLHFTCLGSKTVNGIKIHVCVCRAEETFHFETFEKLAAVTISTLISLSTLETE